MRVRRLGRPDEAWHAVEIDYNLVSFGALLRHLRKLPGLTVVDSMSWPLTDDYQADIRYKGHRLEIDSFFVDFTVSRGEGCPEGIILEVVRHLESVRPWWPNRLAAAASERYRPWKRALFARGVRSVIVNSAAQQADAADEVRDGS
jgi:hypothetical protein